MVVQWVAFSESFANLSPVDPFFPLNLDVRVYLYTVYTLIRNA